MIAWDYDVSFIHDSSYPSPWVQNGTTKLALLGLFPPKPSGFMARKQAGGSQIKLSWDTAPPASGIKNYQVQQKENDGGWSSWADISGSGERTTSHTVTGLSASSSYNFRIRAVYEYDNGPPSDIAMRMLSRRAESALLRTLRSTLWSE